MIYKHTGQLLADRLGQQNCCNRRIHTAGKCTQHLAVSNLLRIWWIVVSTKESIFRRLCIHRYHIRNWKAS